LLQLPVTAPQRARYSPSQPQAVATPKAPLLDTQGIFFSYGHNLPAVLKGVDLQITRGQAHWFCGGPPGSGKARSLT